MNNEFSASATSAKVTSRTVLILIVCMSVAWGALVLFLMVGMLSIIATIGASAVIGLILFYFRLKWNGLHFVTLFGLLSLFSATSTYAIMFYWASYPIYEPLRERLPHGQDGKIDSSFKINYPDGYGFYIAYRHPEGFNADEISEFHKSHEKDIIGVKGILRVSDEESHYQECSFDSLEYSGMGYRFVKFNVGWLKLDKPGRHQVSLEYNNLVPPKDPAWVEFVVSLSLVVFKTRLVSMQIYQLLFIIIAPLSIIIIIVGVMLRIIGRHSVNALGEQMQSK